MNGAPPRPLQNKGGATLTTKPGIGSSAVDAGDNASCASDDQRGVPRPQGALRDIGAAEIAPIVSIFG